MKTYVLAVQVEVPIAAGSEAAARQLAKQLKLADLVRIKGVRLNTWADSELVDVSDAQEPLKA